MYGRIRAIKILSVLNVRADAKTRTVPELTAGNFNGLGKPDKIRNDFLEFILRAVGTSAGTKTVNGHRRDREYGVKRKKILREKPSRKTMILVEKRTDSANRSR